MTEDQIGQICALGAAITWAGGLVLFKRCTEHISPMALNLFKNSFALLLFIPTILVLPLWTEYATTGALRALTRYDLAILAISGVIGIGLADTLFFYGLRIIGVGLTTIVDCTYTPFVLLFSWLLISERLETVHFVGASLIIVGLLVSSRVHPPAGRTRRELIIGMSATVGSIGMMAYGIVLARPVLQGADLVWATAIRLLAGTLFLMFLTLFMPREWGAWRGFTRRDIWAFSIPGSLLGAYVCLLFWVAGFKYGDNSGIVAVLNQTSAFFAIILAAIFLKETMTRRKLMAIGLALTGVLTIWSPKLFAPSAGQELHEQLPALSASPMLPEVDSLPRSQPEPAVVDRNG